MKIISLTVIGCLFLGVASALKPICGVACSDLSKSYQYDNCGKKAKASCLCQSTNYLESLALCMGDRCTPGDWDWAVNFLCNVNGESGPFPSLNEIFSNATKFASPAPKNASTPITYPARFPDKKFANYFETSNNHIGNKNKGTFYGWLLCVFAGILCLFGAIQHHVLAPLMRRPSSDLEGIPQSSRSTTVAWIKRHLLLPATFGSAHIRHPFNLSFPLRMQSILIAIYVALNIIFISIHYKVFEENIKYPGRTDLQLSRYVADRTGILAMAQIPLLLAFAGRNNILISLTGWSYGTFNVWHKWISRMCLFHTFVHSVVFTVFMFQKGGAAALPTKEFYGAAFNQWGAVGTVAVSLMCFQAMYVFRRYWYEFFLVVHIVLAIVFLIGTWYHLLLKDGDFMEWLMAGFGIWAFDRFVRIIRLMVLNISWRKGRVARTARLEMIGTDAIKATVSVGYNISFQPGQYVYIYFPRFNFWESHPFTIASYDVSKTSASQPTLSLLFRTRGGITRKLQKYLETGPKDMVCLVEGPYGHHVHLERYDNVLLLAGGVGITTIFAYLKHLVNMDVRRVRFVWTVRDEDSMRWFSEEIAETLKSENIEVEIHITKSDNGEVGMEPVRIVEELELKKVETGGATTNAKEVDSDANSFASHIFVGDKPDLTELITQESANCKGSLAVLACGPDTFVDEIRKAVADNVVKAKGVIDYFEEAYSW